MGKVREETKHEELPVEIMVVEREKGEFVEPWRIISVDLDGMERLTPGELCILGNWLTEQGNRISQEYLSNGARRNG